MQPHTRERPESHCVGPVPRVDDDEDDVSGGEITQIAGVMDQEGGMLPAWRVLVPVS